MILLRRLCVAALLSVLALTALGQTRPASRPIASPITQAELRERGIEGRLGVRLGTIVHITGTVVDVQPRSKGDASEPFFLRVETVDGRNLETPPIFASSDHALIQCLPGLKIGDSFRCVGYETGSFRGIVNGQFTYMPLYADTSFGFSARFVVLKPE